jgi:hypothetical protein
MSHFSPARWDHRVALYDIVCHNLCVIGSVLVTVGDVLSSPIGWAECGFDLAGVDGDLDRNVDTVACFVGVHSLLSCDGKKLAFLPALKTADCESRPQLLKSNPNPECFHKQTPQGMMIIRGYSLK